MVTVSGQQEPIAAPEAERPAIDAIERFLAGQGDDPVCLFDAEGQPIPLPDSARRVLAVAVHELARDHAVAIVPVYRELTTQQAADLLNVSRQYLIRLLERGDLPFTRTGTHRRIRLD
ncbi:MAG TPA: excisionase family DNA-binding protein, partial [Thermomicrobiales bacterium]|nr:excisionase family DNA-binding protein [Thermomicrobiales bacterium]